MSGECEYVQLEILSVSSFLGIFCWKFDLLLAFSHPSRSDSRWPALAVLSVGALRNITFDISSKDTR
jgi:hypothetical protein